MKDSDPYFYIMLRGKEIGALYPFIEFSKNLYSSELALILEPDASSSLPPYFDITKVCRDTGKLIFEYKNVYLAGYKIISCSDKSFGVEDFIMIHNPVFCIKGD